MSNNNSIVSFGKNSLTDIQEGLGITQLAVGSEDSWYQILGGLIFQGGKTGVIPVNTLSAAISFNTAFPKKVLGIWIIPISSAIDPTGELYSFAVSPVDLVSFKIANDGSDTPFYWLAVGF